LFIDRKRKQQVPAIGAFYHRFTVVKRLRNCSVSGEIRKTRLSTKINLHLQNTGFVANAKVPGLTFYSARKTPSKMVVFLAFTNIFFQNRVTKTLLLSF